MLLSVCIIVYMVIFFQIYDITTGERIVRLYDPDKANNYKTNRAIFSPTDDLVLNDGVLWDVRSAKAIHKFDKFNQFVSGVFNPSGLEIIINSEIVSLKMASQTKKLIIFLVIHFNSSVTPVLF